MTTESGGRDGSDADCWTMVDSIINVWDQTSHHGYKYDYWNNYFISPEVFEDFVKHELVTAEFLTPFILDYFDYKDARDLQHVQDLAEYRQYNTSPGRDMLHPCRDFWDCPAVGLATASLGVSVLQTSAAACTATGVGTPACGPAAGYLTGVDMGLNGLAVGYEINKFAQGNSTSMDLSVTAADNVIKPISGSFGAGASVTPGVGILYDGVMLLYELFINPFIQTPGITKEVK